MRWCRNSLVRKPQNGLWYQNKDMIKEAKNNKRRTRIRKKDCLKRKPRMFPPNNRYRLPQSIRIPLRRQPLKDHRSAHTVDGSGAQLQYLWLYWRVFGVHRAGSVSATKIPAVNTAPETTASIDYSKIGSLKDIISTLDYTSFPQEIKQVYVPGAIAEGYRETSREEGSKFVNVFYVKRR